MPMNLFADSEGPDQTARMRSLIWAFAVRLYPRYVFEWKAHIIYDNTVEPQWLKHVWDQGHLFELWVVRATEG